MRRILLLLMILITCKFADATHIYGGDLLYTHIGGDQYRITLTLYGDCSGSAFPRLHNARPAVRLYKNKAIWSNIDLSEDVSQRKEVSPVCPEEAHNTACRDDGDKSLPGVMMFVYTATTTMEEGHMWEVVFEGAMGNNTAAGRSNSITNIIFGSSGQVMTLIATLNNINGHNSSPQYTTIPTPFYCINTPQQYNQGAVDPDNDSLYFSLTPALRTRTLAVTYRTPFSEIDPLNTLPGSFSFDSSSGQMDFTPDAIQRSLVVNKVEEYKDGVLVGSSMREMTFIVLDNCDNDPPGGTIEDSTITGGFSVTGYSLNVCTITPEIKFSIPVFDANGNNINVSINNVPQGAIASVVNNNTKTPIIRFYWNLQNASTGFYNMYATYKDDACPLSSSKTVAYTIRVVHPPEVSHIVLEPTNCKHKQVVEFRSQHGLLPRRITVKDESGSIVGTYTADGTNTIIDSFEVGTYFVHVSSDGLPCDNDYSFVVEDGGTYPDAPVHEDIHQCIFDTPFEIYPNAIQGATINWYDMEGLDLNEKPSYNTDSPMVYQWLVSQTVDICESDKDTLSVYIHELPDITITNPGGTACYGDGMYLVASGGAWYEWLPKHKIEIRDSVPYTYINEPSTYVVKGYSEYQCVNTDTVVYDNIQDCCQFSYPNAFSPNNDGMNDGWRPIAFGNMEYYLLSVYNRWGERIFITSDPNEEWDGTYKGKPCDVGTYHYFLKAACLTGNDESVRGTVTLIR